MSTDYKRLIEELFLFGSYEDVELTKIIELLKAADDAYFNDQATLLDDDQYDALKLYAQKTSPADAYFTGIGSAVRGGKIPLPYKMGSLNQVYIGDYATWVSSNHLATCQIVISDKLDGASAMLVYDAVGDLQIAYSRGDGIEGADITRHIQKMGVPKKIDNQTGATVTIRAENIIAKSKFAEANTGKLSRGGRVYKNPRNAVSGLMNSSENNPLIYQYIDTVAYEIVGSTAGKLEQLTQLGEWGFNVVSHVWGLACDFDDTRLSNMLNERRASSDYELDGVVIDVDSSIIRAAMGFESDGLNPKYAVKFKVADSSNFAVATVRQVEWNVSKDGYYKPRVQIVPVDLVGVTISNLTGFNAKFIKDNGIGPGSKIEITRSGDVIPFILRTVEATTPQLPDDEDAIWTETGVDLVVADAANNETARFERLVDFFASVDVPHLGEGNLRQMFDLGFDAPEKIIPLTLEDIGSLVGSMAIGKKIFTNMRERFTNIPMHVLMGSCSVFGRGVGVRKMKKLEEAFAGDMTKCANFDQIVAVEGFEAKTAKKIVAGYPLFVEFKAKIDKYVSIAPFVAKKQGHLSGKSFVFTGFRSKEMEARIVDAGGTMSTGVSSKTSYLVTAEPNSTSGKAVKARDLGVTVISQDELKAML